MTWVAFGAGFGLGFLAGPLVIVIAGWLIVRWAVPEGDR